MSYLRVCAYAVAVAAVVSFSANADAGGSFGGSSGGSSGGMSNGSSGGGGLLSGLRARMASRGCSGGSSGGAISSRGSSGGSIGSGSSGGGGLLARLKARRSSGSCGGSTGSSGGYVAARSGSSGGSVGSGSSGGRVGPLKKLVANIRARRASSGSSGGSSGGYVSRGSSGGSSGGVSYSTPAVSYATPVSYSSPVSYAAPVQTISYGASADGYESPVVQSSYDTYAPVGETIIDSGSVINSGSSVLDSGTIIDSAPIDSSSSVGIDGQSVSHEVRKAAIDADAALLTVAVPNDSAKVTVNGHETKSSGSVRQFMSRGLEDGFVYTYVVKVQYEFNGTPKTDSKEVKLRSGQTEQVVFEPAKEEAKPAEENSAAAAKPVTTVVKLHVPSGAKVNLAGTDTNGKGMIRTFRTKSLKSGESWTDYTVRVTANIGGQNVSKEQTVNVAAGSTTELTFEFDAADVAKN